uniref:TLC domain-containing protein n=1 Tax=Glossina brevipalpis TaxID=37001 RepID=A0A1A9W8R8_9MUSC
MYKTIRHGENSLQYTILPQNDDFRLEGKIKSVSGGKKTRAKKPKRRSFFAYLGVIFVCTVIVGAVLIPFLVSAECLPDPTQWFLKTKAAFSKHSISSDSSHVGKAQNNNSGSVNNNKQLSSPVSINKGNLITSDSINVGKTVKIINQNGIEKIILKVNKTKLPDENNTIAPLQYETNGIHTENKGKAELSSPITITHLANIEQIVGTTRKTVTTQEIISKENNHIVSEEAETTTNVNSANPQRSAAVILPTTSNLNSFQSKNILNPTTAGARFIQVPLLKGTARKAGIPPALAKNYSKLFLTTTEKANSNPTSATETASKINLSAKNNKTTADWIQAHWPYIDPSTYFQWNGYKAEDSVLLPALLGFALIGVILIITVCLVARNKRTIVNNVRKRNRNVRIIKTTMAIKPGMGRKTSSKNPPILSHEFVIQNHADIISCVAMVFVLGLMDESTSPFASAFISLHHNVTGEEPSREQPLGKPFTYVAGIKDYCAIFFYTLTCVIMHAIIQEFILDKISKKLHLSKYKLSLFNESGQLVTFYVMSFLWGANIVMREGYFTKFSLLWDDFPQHPMTFLHKFYFIIQLSYYLHMLPELYFQKVKKEDQQPKIVHAVCGFSVICLAYTFGFQRIALVLLTLHYLSEIVAHVFQLISVFDRDEKLASTRIVNSAVFVFVRFTTMVIGVLTLYYGVVATTSSKLRGFMALIGLMALQGYLIFSFITEQLKAKREAQQLAKHQASQKKTKATKEKAKRKRESDLPEADQSPNAPKAKDIEEHGNEDTTLLTNNNLSDED